MHALKSSNFCLKEKKKKKKNPEVNLFTLKGGCQSFGGYKKQLHLLLE